MTLDKIANALPSAKRLTFQGAGHVPHMSHREQYAEALKQFAGVHEKV
jgi:pimeloyl-ACP methyl ester carboxylesterase